MIASINFRRSARTQGNFASDSDKDGSSVIAVSGTCPKNEQTDTYVNDNVAGLSDGFTLNIRGSFYNLLTITLGSFAAIVSSFYGNTPQEILAVMRRTSGYRLFAS